MPPAPGDPARIDAAPPGTPDTGADVIDALHRQVADLREAVASHERIGIATGLLAHRFDRSPERAWQMLVRLSQLTNVKLRTVAQTLVDAHSGRPHEDGGELADTVEDLLSVLAEQDETGSATPA